MIRRKSSCSPLNANSISTLLSHRTISRKPNCLTGTPLRHRIRPRVFEPAVKSRGVAPDEAGGDAVASTWLGAAPRRWSSGRARLCGVATPGLGVECAKKALGSRHCPRSMMGRRLGCRCHWHIEPDIDPRHAYAPGRPAWVCHPRWQTQSYCLRACRLGLAAVITSRNPSQLNSAILRATQARIDGLVAYAAIVRACHQFGSWLRGLSRCICAHNRRQVGWP